MKRADKFDLVKNAGSLAQQKLYMGAVFSDNIGQVAAGVVKPVTVKIHLVSEKLAIQGAKGTKSCLLYTSRCV